MEKNENGYPVSPTDDDRENINGTEPRLTEQEDNTARRGEAAENTDNAETCLDSRPLAYVYAPDQQFRMLYSAKDALDHGTLFEELFKPMEVYGRE